MKDKMVNISTVMSFNIPIRVPVKLVIKESDYLSRNEDQIKFIAKLALQQQFGNKSFTIPPHKTPTIADIEVISMSLDKFQDN